jgi:3-(methylthio)propanoyl-CoA dehydrogenase
MTNYVVPLQDTQFIISQLAGLDEIGQLPGYEEATSELTFAVLEEAAKFAEGVLAPLNVVGDTEGCRLDDGVVRTATGWKQAYRQFSDAGWVGLTMPMQYGGQDLPKIISAPVTEMWFAANMAFSLLAPMASGAAETLLRAADDELKARYLPKLASGEWTTAMDLTEPGSGSDLGTIRTRAEPQEDGTYRIFGQKIFITYGDHDLADNIVHLVLARLQGAPAGTRGISMFIVPKILLDGDGNLSERNDVSCVSLERKLGIHGSPTCVMNFGESRGATGYLVGEAGRGLEYMFVMVNDSRFNVGLQGIGVGERAYQQAEAYAITRAQGRDAMTGEKNVPIIRHPDVKRMLFAMKSRVMASRMLAFTAAGWFDLARRHPDPSMADHYRALVDLMMPVVKGWSTEIGIEVASMGIQVQGGMGFIEETGAAQYLRDVRITTIYEGTTGIQANDLIGRKIRRDNGVTLTGLIDDIRATVGQASDSGLSDLGGELAEALDLLASTRDWILNEDTEINELLAGSVSFLHLLGVVCGAWQMARAVLAAERLIASGLGDEGHLQGIIELAQFYFAQVLPQAAMHAKMTQRAGAVVVGRPNDGKRPDMSASKNREMAT